MYEESATAVASSTWAYMISWFTPTVFFVLLNLMIGTIAFTSKLANQKQQRHSRDQNEPTNIATPPTSTSILHRLKSTNFYPQNNLSSIHHKPNPYDSNLETQSHYFFEQASSDHQENFHTSQSQPTYLFEQTHQQIPQETQSQFVFEPKDSTLDDFEQPQFVFEQKDSTLNDFDQPQFLFEQKDSATLDDFGQTQFVFEQKDSTLADFDQPQFLSNQKDSTLSDFDQPQFLSNQKDSSLDDFEQPQFFFEPKDSTLDDSKQPLHQNPQETQSQLFFEQKDSTLDDFKQPHESKFEENEPQSMDEVYSQLTGSHVSRSKSASGEMPPRLPARMKKSASVKSAFGHFEEETAVEARRPATVRERGNAEGDAGVDAKADDFINKFKHQLKLQRLDSIIRYKDMIGRGSVGKS